MRRRIVAGNWKMNGSQNLVTELVGPIAQQVRELGIEVGVLPPALYVSEVIKAANSAMAVGVQNVSERAHGAYTGEISAPMAADVGCRYGLVGHSERRQLFGETDIQVAVKTEQLLNAGLSAIVCVGETLAQREAGQAEAIVANQVLDGLSKVTPEQWGQIVIAYEPVWAIGTGKTATSEDAQAMHKVIRGVLDNMGAPAESISLLYGGSVKADNAAALFAEPDIDGGLIGGASLSATDFVSICQALPADTHC
ncbi:MAG TPA: triose-phosphate isomerase [Marinobacter sp.]|nr:triose-phosphate isomerase [Marinobacter sp.]